MSQRQVAYVNARPISMNIPPSVFQIEVKYNDGHVEHLVGDTTKVAEFRAMIPHSVIFSRLDDYK